LTIQPVTLVPVIHSPTPTISGLIQTPTATSTTIRSREMLTASPE
jgi:hypothetical protein